MGFSLSSGGEGPVSASTDYADKPLEKPLKLVLKVGGSEVTELSGSGHDSSYYDDRSDHERERHREKKKKKKKKSEKEKYLDDEERRKRKVKESGGCRIPEGQRSSAQGILLVVGHGGRCFSPGSWCMASHLTRVRIFARVGGRSEEGPWKKVLLSRSCFPWPRESV